MHRPACHRCGAPLADPPDGPCPSCGEAARWTEGVRRDAGRAFRFLIGRPSAVRADLAEFLARVRRPRFSRGEVLGAVALLVGACSWPVLLGVAVASILVAILHRAGTTVVEGIVMVATLGVLIAICFPPSPPDHSYRNHIRQAVPPVPEHQRPMPRGDFHRPGDARNRPDDR